jgi:putative transposase
MDERLAFVREALRREQTITTLCRAYGISRKTGYQVLGRYRTAGEPGLVPRSRAPHHSPQAVRPAVQAAILALRTAHPTWGPRKLQARLRRAHPAESWPAASSIGALLQRMGRSCPRPAQRRGHPLAGPPGPLTASEAPNDVWTIDFKGWFCTQDGERCDPLTLVDDMSRYLLRCVALRGGTAAQVQPWVERAFREYGLPAVLRSDNGTPFAMARGLVRLSRLAVWWLKLGIRPEQIEPARPDQNARHERLHRTLKEETASPPRRTRCAQQRAFDRFRGLYNHERPHEALAQQPPASLYTPSPRPYPARVASPEYGPPAVVRRVRGDGDIKWRGTHVFLSQALAGEPVGLEEVADGCWRVSFGPLSLGCLHAGADRLHPADDRLEKLLPMSPV